MNNSTSWVKAANWYDNLLEKEENTYQKNLILPNILRLLEIKKGETILDLACGQGFFSREFSKAGAKVVGVDISKELIELAKNHSSTSSNLTIKQLNNDTGNSSRQARTINYYVSPADDLRFLKDKSIDKTVIILALQNIQNVYGVFKECSRVLKKRGRLFIVLNHPAFRIPKESSWGWDEGQKIQYRRIDSYLSQSKAKIQMHPGISSKEYTLSFHRPLQFYSKSLSKNGFCITRIEEWNSFKKSEPGPKAQAEDKARKEIPLFLFIGAISGHPRLDRGSIDSQSS